MIRDDTITAIIDHEYTLRIYTAADNAPAVSTHDKLCAAKSRADEFAGEPLSWVAFTSNNTGLLIGHKYRG